MNGPPPIDLKPGLWFAGLAERLPSSSGLGQRPLTA